jgi:short-subunit dehydrogenase
VSRGVAVITGATAGIGREFADQLGARGYDLLLVARDRQRLSATAESLAAAHGVAAEAFPADLSRDEEVSLLAERLAATPGLSLLVNNAGFGSRGRLAETDIARQEAMIRLHVLAPMRLTRAALPALLARRSGGVVNVSSVAGFIYSAGNVNYCATKAYLTTFSEGLAVELHGTGVRVQALCPGFTRTEFHARMSESGETHPRFLWLSARAVVAYSLECLERGGPVVCVPGFRWRLIVLAIRHLPRSLIGWATRRQYSRV